MTSAALARRRNYCGPALFSYGFRPFFLGAATWAALAIVLWVLQFSGRLSLHTAFAPLDWHVHEMLYGYVAAAIAGFLLTAIPNWTGRLPVTGAPLAALAGLWLAGRIAMLASAPLGLPTAAAIDMSFLLALAAVAAREIVAGRNWRNLRVLIVLGVLIAGNLVFHIEAQRYGAADYGIRLGLAAVVGLIMLIGGRVVPSFTHNWLARRGAGRLPVPFSRFDAACLAASVPGLAGWVAWPQSEIVGLWLILCALLQLVRLIRWAGDRTFADRLVLVLHVAYAFVPIGFALVGASMVWPASVPPGAGIHAWTVGAVGLMTLAVMTRATLGHTGQPLSASPSTQIVYALALLAVGARIIGAFEGSMALIYVAGLAWVASFGAFLIVYGPLLLSRPPAWKTGC